MIMDTFLLYLQHMTYLYYSKARFQYAASLCGKWNPAIANKNISSIAGLQCTGYIDHHWWLIVLASLRNGLSVLNHHNIATSHQKYLYMRLGHHQWYSHITFSELVLLANHNRLWLISFRQHTTNRQFYWPNSATIFNWGGMPTCRTL